MKKSSISRKQKHSAHKARKKNNEQKQLAKQANEILQRKIKDQDYDRRYSLRPSKEIIESAATSIRDRARFRQGFGISTGLYGFYPELQAVQALLERGEPGIINLNQVKVQDNSNVIDHDPNEFKDKSKYK